MASGLQLERDIPEGGRHGVGALAVGQRRFVVLHEPEGIGESGNHAQAAVIRQPFGQRFRCTQVRELLLILGRALQRQIEVAVQIDSLLQRGTVCAGGGPGPPAPVPSTPRLPGRRTRRTLWPPPADSR